MGQQILLAPNNVRKFGTCEVTQVFGTVKSATLDETVDEEIWEDCCNDAAAVLLHNHRYELSLDILFESDKASAAVIGAQIDFPVASVKGNITGVTVKWESGGKKMLTIKAKHWKSLGNRVAQSIEC